VGQQSRFFDFLHKIPIGKNIVGPIKNAIHRNLIIMEIAESFGESTHRSGHLIMALLKMWHHRFIDAKTSKPP
jgi:hypothetical protein